MKAQERFHLTTNFISNLSGRGLKNNNSSNSLDGLVQNKKNMSSLKRSKIFDHDAFKISPNLPGRKSTDDIKISPRVIYIRNDNDNSEEDSFLISKINTNIIKKKKLDQNQNQFTFHPSVNKFLPACYIQRQKSTLSPMKPRHINRIS